LFLSARFLNFGNVVLRPIKLPTQARRAFAAWRPDSLNPLIPQMIELARRVSAAPIDDP
jgi:hypothetical protein